MLLVVLALIGSLTREELIYNTHLADAWFNRHKPRYQEWEASAPFDRDDACRAAGNAEAALAYVERDIERGWATRRGVQGQPRYEFNRDEIDTLRGIATELRLDVSHYERRCR